MTSSPATSHTPVIFRDDGAYRLTQRQHAALAYAANAALDRTGASSDRHKKLEDITQTDLFRKRYLPLLRRAEFQVNPQGIVISSKNKNSEEDRQLTEKLVLFLKTIRNYFSHYTHTSVDIKALASDALLKNFLPLLYEEAKSVWLAQHDAWKEDAPSGGTGNVGKERVNAIRDFAWDKEFNILGLERLAGQGSLPMRNILLLLSIFVPKGVMFRLMSSLYGLKSSANNADTTEKNAQQPAKNIKIEPAKIAQQVAKNIKIEPAKIAQQVAKNIKIESARSLLASLCMRESHDFVSTCPHIVTAMTILDNFARRTGNRQGTEQGLPHPQKEEKGQEPDMAKRFRPHFAIKMLVAAIEANDWLPNVTFARSFAGLPDFSEEKKSCELYIRHNNVAFCYTPENNPAGVYGQFSLHALMVIVLFLLKKQDNAQSDTKNNPLTDLLNKYLLPAANFLEKAGPGTEINLPKQLLLLSTKQLLLLPKRLRTPEVLPVHDESITPKTVEALRTLVHNVDRRRFPVPSALGDHAKAHSVLWWINKQLPVDHKLRKEAYMQAFLGMTGTYNGDELHNTLPDIPCKVVSLNKQTLRSFVKGSNSLNVLYARIRNDYRRLKTEAFPDDVSSDTQGTDKALLHLGTLCACAVCVTGQRRTRLPLANPV